MLRVGIQNKICEAAGISATCIQRNLKAIVKMYRENPHLADRLFKND